MAADYVINLIIEGIPGCKLPHGALLDSQWSGLSEEEVLARLLEDAAGGGEAYEDAAGGWAAADSIDSAGSPQDLSAQWAQAVQQAAALGARQGQLVGSIGRLAAVQSVRRIDWRAALAGFLTAPLPDRADWSRTSRRAAGRGYIVPRHCTEQALLHMVVVRDTSGSISDADLGRCNAVIEAVMAQHPGLAVTLLDCDAQVHAQITLCPGDKVPAHAQGGDGTDFRPAFAVIDALVADEMRIGGVVYITDLAGTFPADAPAYPVLWVTAEDNAAVPFGSVVTIN
jgi:predicted metal-dependent peptidase